MTHDQGSSQFVLGIAAQLGRFLLTSIFQLVITTVLFLTDVKPRFNELTTAIGITSDVSLKFYENFTVLNVLFVFFSIYFFNSYLEPKKRLLEFKEYCAKKGSTVTMLLIFWLTPDYSYDPDHGYFHASKFVPFAFLTTKLLNSTSDLAILILLNSIVGYILTDIHRKHDYRFVHSANVKIAKTVIRAREAPTAEGITYEMASRHSSHAVPRVKSVVVISYIDDDENVIKNGNGVYVLVGNEHRVYTATHVVRDTPPLHFIGTTTNIFPISTPWISVAKDISYLVVPNSFGSVLGLSAAKLKPLNFNKPVSIVSFFDSERSTRSTGNLLNKTTTSYREYTVDYSSRPGDSGSPIFQDNHVVGIHGGSLEQSCVNVCYSLYNQTDVPFKPVPKTTKFESSTSVSDKFEDWFIGSDVHEMFRNGRNANPKAWDVIVQYEGFDDFYADYKEGNRSLHEQLQVIDDMCRNGDDKVFASEFKNLVKNYEIASNYKFEAVSTFLAPASDFKMVLNQPRLSLPESVKKGTFPQPPTPLITKVLEAPPPSPETRMEMLEASIQRLELRFNDSLPTPPTTVTSTTTPVTSVSSKNQKKPKGKATSS